MQNELLDCLKMVMDAMPYPSMNLSGIPENAKIEFKLNAWQIKRIKLAIAKEEG